MCYLRHQHKYITIMITISTVFIDEYNTRIPVVPLKRKPTKLVSMSPTCIHLLTEKIYNVLKCNSFVYILVL